MRTYGTIGIPNTIPQSPDSVQSLLLAAGVAQNFDWPNSTGGAAANATTAQAQVVRFTFMTTAGALLGGMVNLFSTNANAPTSGSSATTGTTAGSTGNSVPVLGQALYQIPGYSTGWSAASPSSGWCIAEIWRK